MKNVIETKIPELMLQATKAIPAVASHGTSLELILDPARMQLNLNNLVTSGQAFLSEKNDLSIKRAAAKGILSEAFEFTMTARNVITTYTGRKPSTVLAGAGFPNSLRIPRRPARLLMTLRGIQKYLTDNPAHENPLLNVSAARAATLITDIEQTRTAVNVQKADLKTALNVRNNYVKLVRNDLRILLNDLTTKISPMSEMWIKFGLSRPGIREVPPAPENVSVVLTSPDAASIKWDRAPRAESYRVWQKVVGVDTEFRLIDTRTDLDFKFEGLPPDATIEHAISAVNNGGESKLSEPVTIVTDERSEDIQSDSEPV